LGLLKRLIEADDEAVVIFYGGEPLLNPGFIMRVMDNVRARRFGAADQWHPSESITEGLLEEDGCGVIIH